MKITVKKLDGAKGREIELSEYLFGYEYKEHLVHLAVEAVRAARRAGTHKVKVRSEVRGSGRKLWRQKGTGRARVGSIRTPLWRSGGTVHGPQPRSYETRMTARDKRNALRSVLSRKLEDGRVMVVESFDLDDHKTKNLAAKMDGLGIDAKALLVERRGNENLERAAGNNPLLEIIDPLAVNVYDVVAKPWLVFSADALEELTRAFGRDGADNEGADKEEVAS